MSPYTICENQPGYLPEQGPYAVATIDEAREIAHDTLYRWEDDHAGDDARIEPLYDAAKALPVSGGVIGPLPDGCIIDVRPTTYKELCAFAGLAATELYGLRDERREQILGAYNDDAA